MNDPDERAQFAIESTKVVTALNNPIEQEQYFNYIAKHTNFSVDALKRQANYAVKTAPEKPQARIEQRQAAQRAKPLDDAVKFYLSSIVNGREYAQCEKNVKEAMPDDFTANLYEWCRDNVGFDRTDLEAAFADVENELYRRVLETEIARLNEIVKTASDKNEIIERIGKLSTERSKLTKYRS